MALILQKRRHAVTTAKYQALAERDTAFDGPVGLRNIMVTKMRGLFVENFTERLLTYALGRGVEEYDRPVIRKIVRETAADDNKWSSIILSIVKSKPFQMIQSRGA